MTQEEFVEHLHRALKHLYEPDRLRQSPLAALFGVAHRLDTFSALQNILTEAIESLEPKPDEFPQSPAWEIYEPLFYRYVQQLNQEQVARQLGMSVRHLRRKEHVALEVLASRLWMQFDLEARLQAPHASGSALQAPHASGSALQAPHASRGSGDRLPTLLPWVGSDQTPASGGGFVGEGFAAGIAGPTVSDELAWLKDVPPESPVDLNQMLPDVLALAGPLATQHQARMHISVADDLPSLAVHAVALSQALLNLLTVAIHQAAGSTVSISARALPLEVEIRIQVTPRPDRIGKPARSSRDDAASLDLARQLAELCGGRLAHAGDEEPFEARLTLPSIEQLPVLVIDDNADTLQLLRRYAAGTRYHLATTQDPAQALSLADKVLPRIIVLDVMMPRVDGWKVLAQLRQHPSSGHTPIVVCTILPQEEMAFALGASGFIRKPVTRQAFLAALDQQINKT